MGVDQLFDLGPKLRIAAAGLVQVGRPLVRQADLDCLTEDGVDIL
jgi:hypothetical protein